MDAIEPQQKVQKESVQELDSQIARSRDRVLSIISRAEEIISTPDLSTMVQHFLDLIIDVTLADSANFFQVDAPANELVITHVAGNPESQYLIGLRLKRQQGLPGKSLGESEITVVDDLTSDQDWMLTVDPANALRKKNVINLPITNKNNAIGVIQVFNFKQLESDLLLILAGRLAVELDRRKEMTTIQHSNERLLTLLDMLGDVAGTLDRNQLLHLVTEDAARLVDAERSSLFLVNPSTSEMMFQVAYQTTDQEEISSSSADTDKHARSTRSSQYISKKTSRHTQDSNLPVGEFSYFNRAAITVPLQSGPQSHAHSEGRKHILGGLMVLNNRNASFQEEDAQLIRILADQASTFLQVAEIYENTEELFLGVIKSLVAAIDAKDAYTQGHSQRVSDYSVLISRELGLDEITVTDIRIGSLLHDIGKIGIPDGILMKNSSLSNEEIKIMREHPRTGASILSQVKAFDQLQPAILEHHERLDGSGYPGKLIDTQISLMGRIVAVADVFDALTSNRPYRQALSNEEALSYLREKAGILFDPLCVDTLINVLASTTSMNSWNAKQSSLQ